MFNLKKHGAKTVNLIDSELSSFDIQRHPEGFYKITIGDERLKANSLEECIELIEDGITELKDHIWDLWKRLEYLSEVVLQNDTGNKNSIDNILFLNSVKKSFLLSKRFPELQSASEAIERLFNVDISSVCQNLIVQFNQMYLSIKLLHRLIMIELYRIRLARRCQRVNKVATVEKRSQISGPWANLDLPTRERMWEFDEDEEFFENRQRSRREQVRYNPENIENAVSDGFYYIWQDLTRGPYDFGDREDSPYKSRLLLTQP